MVVFRFDRCPHCGRWKLVQKYHPDVLAAAAEAMQQAEDKSTRQSASSPEEKLRRQLEDSRFDDNMAGDK